MDFHLLPQVRDQFFDEHCAQYADRNGSRSGSESGEIADRHVPCLKLGIGFRVRLGAPFVERAEGVVRDLVVSLLMIIGCRISFLPQFLEDRRNKFRGKIESALRQALEKWPCRHDKPGALRLHYDARGSRATQTESACGLARRQLIENHQGAGPMCERRPYGARLTFVQRRQQRPRGIAGQNTDLPAPYRCGDLRLTRAAESGEHLRSNRRRDKRSAVQLAQPGKRVETCEPDKRTRVDEGYCFARHASRFLRSSRRVFVLPRTTGMPSCERCNMKSASGMSAILAPRPSVTLSLR